jgi:hypothetical protein
MARNWLVSAELPSTFWFYAVRHTAEVCNYFPIQLEDGSTTTPFELVHRTKPDLRVLFKPFTLAAVRQERIGDESLPKFESQSVPMITLGRCPNSYGLQFYNPVTGATVSSIDYSFQHHVSSGSCFGLKYQPGTFVYRLDESTTMFFPRFPLESTVLVHTHSPPHLATVIGVHTYSHPNIYTVKYSDGSISEYSDADGILEATNTPHPISVTPLLPDWIQGGSTATLFTNDMPKPRHGCLRTDSEGNCFFFALATLLILLRVLYYQIYLLIISTFLTLVNFLRDILNSLGFIRLGIRLN